MVCDRANNGDGVQWEHGGFRRAPHADSLAQDFVATGIDDLAKYHVMRLLFEHPATAGDAEYFARYLGFHSIAVTRALLDELVVTGVLVRDFAPRELYRLVPDGDARRRLVRLYNDVQAQGDQEGMLRTLSARSLQKARSRALATKRDQERAGASQFDQRISDGLQ